MGDGRTRNPDKERAVRAKAMESLRDLFDYYAEVHWSQGMKNVGKAISLLKWLKQV